jgi:hypothetical protein
MIPLFAHRFIPAEPLDEDNPVFSIMGADVICYGRNLLHYIYNEIFDFTPCKYVVFLICMCNFVKQSAQRNPVLVEIGG